MASDQAGQPPRRTYPTRQCRLCFEECEATVELPPTGSASRNARVKYYSTEDPSLGQLISPCNCTGSARFIHEGCLNAWRKNAAQRQHFWECNICHFQYRFSRLGWARLLENPFGHYAITAAAALLLVFIFGYIADPIINLYIDPYSAASTKRLWTPIKISDVGEERSWIQHFYKGLASLGVLSFARVLLMANPWHWYNIRSSGLAHGTARPGATGQDRVANISWVVLVVGVITFLYTVFKAMNALTRWFLERAAFHIKEVPHEEEDLPEPGQPDMAPNNNDPTSPNPPRWVSTSEETVGSGPSSKDSESTKVGATVDDLARGQSLRHRGVPVMPGSFDAPSWSFSSLDR